ncbi:hypothetical protein Pyn_34333 [Prunus yedoensis var. nudiflora]|uniref:Uncharacterized protein n=1 Tax=Prunus yedoensis var. nudiflora TaxID=2094558 RepID=A0A314UV70_PRUYE|nr:hypothetical protein Pyn_34333 [Prunus yedoensis var. nudiflora]
MKTAESPLVHPKSPALATPLAHLRQRSTKENSTAPVSSGGNVVTESVNIAVDCEPAKENLENPVKCDGGAGKSETCSVHSISREEEGFF